MNVREVVLGDVLYFQPNVKAPIATTIAPETIDRLELSFASDVFACGVMIYEHLTKKVGSDGGAVGWKHGWSGVWWVVWM